MKHSGSGKKVSVGEGLATGAMGSGRGWRCFWKSLYPCTSGEHWTQREEIFLIHKVKEKSLFRNQKAVEGKVLSHSVMSNSLWPPIDCSLLGSSIHGDSPGKIIGVGCHALLQGIFPTQESNPGLLHSRRILYYLCHQGSPRILEWVAYPSSRGTFWPRNRTSVSCIADRLFTSWATREALQVWAPYLLYMNLAGVLVRGWFSDTHCFCFWEILLSK